MSTRPIENNGLGLAPNHADRVLYLVEQSMVRLQDGDGIYREWRGLVRLHMVSGKNTHGARIIAAMNVYGITNILTFNGDDFNVTQGSGSSIHET